MGFVDSVIGLFFLRLFMGIFTGFVSTALALIAAQSKKENAGEHLGTLQTGTVSGGLLGPMIGGILADTTGFSLTFIITSLLIALTCLLVFFGVKEIVVSEDEEEHKTSYTKKETLKHIFANPVLIVVISFSFLIQTANLSVQPLLALYVNDLQATQNIAFLSGLAFSVTGLGNLVATRKWGKLGDHIGHERVLVFLLIMAGCFFIPQAFVQHLWQLIGLRFLLGLAIGGIIPCMTGYIRQSSPVIIQGEVLGYNVSFRFLGNVIGPVMGGSVAGWINIPSVFMLSGGLFLIGSALLAIVVSKSKR